MGFFFISLLLENPSKGANNADEDTLTSASSQDPSVVSLILFQDVSIDNLFYYLCQHFTRIASW